MKWLSRILVVIVLNGFIEMNHLYCQKKIPVRVYLEHYRNSKKIVLSVRVITKVDKRYRPTAGIKVDLFTNDKSPENLLATLMTTKDGTARYSFSKDQFEIARKTRIAKYVAVVTENDSLKGRKAEIEIGLVNFDVRFNEKDSVKKIQVLVSKTDTSGMDVPQEGVKIAFLVERPLSPLPLEGELNTTDEYGRLSLIFPDDLPGDKEGYINAMVRIIDNDDFGTVEVNEKKQWGIPTNKQLDVTQRSLWASGANAPISLLIFVVSLILLVWGVVAYIVYMVFQIKKNGKESL